jgi:hypothetical protein
VRRPPPDFENPLWQDQGREFRGNWFHVRTPGGYRACAESIATSGADGVVIPLHQNVTCAEQGVHSDPTESPDYVSVWAWPEWDDRTLDDLVQEQCKGKNAGLVDAKVGPADVHISGWETMYCTGADPHGRYYRVALAYGSDGQGALLFHDEVRADTKNQVTADALLRHVLEQVELYKP